jgi:serine phosphatase RsbU (regulator of sigma subunit)
LESHAQQENYAKFDSLIHLNDSLGRYFDAEKAAKEGLALAENERDIERQAFYNLRLAKFYFELNNTRRSLMHFRLYAVLMEQQVSNQRYAEMRLLEEAYLEQLSLLQTELDLNDQLINRLSVDNSRMESSLSWIYTASKIGGIAIFLIAIIILYDRRSRRKSNETQATEESKEVQRLRAKFEKMEEEQARNQQEIERYKGSHQRQVWYTRHIQSSLLPSVQTTNQKLKQSFVLSFSKEATSGDFFVVHEANNKRVIVLIDCPGHGPDAAYYTVMTNHHLSEILNKAITTPSMILTMMDQKIKQNLEDTGLDKNEIHGSRMAICEIDIETKEVEYAGAGLPLFYVYHDALKMEKGNTHPVGDSIFSDPFYSSVHLRLADGDMIYMFSDGFQRQLGGKKNKKFMRSSLINLLGSMYQQPLTEQKFILEKVLMEWKGKNAFTDDILAVGVQV